MEYLAISIPPDADQVAGLPRGMIADTIERLLAELDARDGDPDLEDGDEDRCPAGDDSLSTGGFGDGHPGDEADAEEGGDLELNGDEGDYSD